MYLPLQQLYHKNTTLWSVDSFSVFVCMCHDRTNPFDRMGDLEPWMDEMYLQKLWLSLNVSVMVKVIRDKAIL